MVRRDKVILSDGLIWLNFQQWLDDAVFMQSTGAYKAASRLAIATPPPAYVLSRGIGWQVSLL